MRPPSSLSRPAVLAQNFIDLEQEAASIATFQLLQSREKAAVEWHEFRMLQHLAADRNGRFRRYQVVHVGEGETEDRLRPPPIPRSAGIDGAGDGYDCGAGRFWNWASEEFVGLEALAVFLFRSFQTAPAPNSVLSGPFHPESIAAQIDTP